MTSDREPYWEKAGVIGYSKAMFSSGDVELHVNRRLWSIALEIGKQLGLERSSRVLDLGCGDGAFANEALAGNFAEIEGFDLAEAAIQRARANSAGAHLKFQTADITKLDFDNAPRYDGAFLIGILHHVKPAAPDVIGAVRRATDRVVVLEPNGNHLLRKILELTPSYRAAGEASFGVRHLTSLFDAAGFRRVVWRRLNLFPNLCPALLFRLLRPLEPFVERSAGLRALCTVDMYGFRADSEPGASS
jgi:cyclopropane fatty-acyl-phospholipid synthase-like methyltransferase